MPSSASGFIAAAADRAGRPRGFSAMADFTNSRASYRHACWPRRFDASGARVMRLDAMGQMPGELAHDSRRLAGAERDALAAAMRRFASQVYGP